MCFNLNLLECKLQMKYDFEGLVAGFNLNLLECKSFYSLCYREFQKGFNLNLLECKFLRYSPIYRAVIVLISTYWNVNPLALLGTALGDASFNLNLLECKF